MWAPIIHAVEFVASHFGPAIVAGLVMTVIGLFVAISLLKGGK
jgi:biopolymer transport protein ExbB/TolQ